MQSWPDHSRGGAALCVVLVSALAGISTARACDDPGARNLEVRYPQGAEAVIKLYGSSKGGRLGTVPASLIQGKLKLCSSSPGNLAEVLLADSVKIDLADGKTAPANRRYWVRSNQVRFVEKGASGTKKFRCERNQTAVRSQGGAAGAEECEK